MQPIFDFGGDGPVMTLAVANGFPPQTYIPLVEPLTVHYRVIGLLPRALWPDEQPPEKRRDWKQMGGVDVARALQEYDLHDVIGIGHSFGGIATFAAAVMEPSRFKGVVLLDPTIFPRPLLWLLWLNQKLNIDLGNPLAARADHRRNRFESVDAAYTYFSGKRLFADWPEETLRLYTESMVPHPDGGLTLAWPREWEAYYFRSTYTAFWQEIPRFRATGLPLLTLRGGDSGTLRASVVAKMRDKLPTMDYAEITGHGHLFPQTAPDETRAQIEHWSELNHS